MPLSLPIMAALLPRRRMAAKRRSTTASRRSRPQRRAVWRWCAWQMAMASASAASSLSNSARGRSTRTIALICAFSAWPAPTIAFLTAFGAYSATARPACAGTSSAMPRAWPSFSVAAASRLTKVCSTAASSGCNARTISARPACSATSRCGELAVERRLDRAGGDEGERIAGDRDDAPAGAAEARIDAEDANRRRSSNEA